MKNNNLFSSYDQLPSTWDEMYCAPVKGVFKGNVEETLLVNVDVSTTKNNHLDYTKTKDFMPTSTNNSYLQNLEIIQHQQQQQQ